MGTGVGNGVCCSPPQTPTQSQQETAALDRQAAAPRQHYQATELCSARIINRRTASRSPGAWVATGFSSKSPFKLHWATGAGGGTPGRGGGPRAGLLRTRQGRRLRADAVRTPSCALRLQATCTLPPPHRASLARLQRPDVAFSHGSLPVEPRLRRHLLLRAAVPADVVTLPATLPGRHHALLRQAGDFGSAGDPAGASLLPHGGGRDTAWAASLPGRELGIQHVNSNCSGGHEEAEADRSITGATGIAPADGGAWIMPGPALSAFSSC